MPFLSRFLHISLFVISCIFFFFFLFSFDFRDLHSFPTRRSSDLGGYVGGSTGGGSSYAPDVSGYYASGGYTGDGGKYEPDRKSTRLNSSHVAISYAVFCLKKKIYLYYQL